MVGGRLLSVVERLSSAPSPRPSLWPWICGVPSVLSVLGARRGPPPSPPPPCALSGAAWVSQLRPLQARFAQLRPRSSTTPSLVTYVVGVAVPAAFMQLRLRRLCCIGTWAPKALRLVVVWVTSGEERHRSLGVKLVNDPSCGVPCARTEASFGTLGGPSAFPWYKGRSGWLA